jgi:hypothetical protein
MTYRNAIQIQIKALQEVYDNAEGLRDIAKIEIEKEAFNGLRRWLPKLWGELQKIDNKLSNQDAAYNCKGNYVVEINEKNLRILKLSHMIILFLIALAAGITLLTIWSLLLFRLTKKLKKQIDEAK